MRHYGYFKGTYRTYVHGRAAPGFANPGRPTRTSYARASAAAVHHDATGLRVIRLPLPATAEQGTGDAPMNVINGLGREYFR